MHLQLEYILFLSLFILLYTKRIAKLSFSMSYLFIIKYS